MLAEIDYTNWKGVRRKRLIMPLSLDIKCQNVYHPITCAAIIAVDLEDKSVKTFPLSHIHSWLDVPGTIHGVES